MLISIMTGIVLAMATILIHALGTNGWIDYLTRRGKSFKDQFSDVKVLVYTAVVLLLLNTAEVLLWATTYFFLVGKEQFSSFEEAVYFSTVTFTSLGYGDVVMTGSWRMLSAFQAMVGILVFGWSSALLFAVVQRIWFRNRKNQHETFRE